ncbi:MAG: YiiX/YebB-like N1pC/P60 family cysteine hydrolase [Bacteroidetes bacterium]|nr:YiiX/YebB-like N1pC/P60 family cysteine hydrolase [Bacteroidota bacterium]
MIKKLYFLIIINILLFNFFVHAQHQDFIVKEGDILFQDLDCGEFCDAVEKVTTAYKGAKFSHLGLVAKNEKGEMVIIEAVSKGVIMTPLQHFLAKSHDKNNNPKVVVGRLKPQYRHLIPAALKAAIKLLGSPYDEVFCMNNNSYYCSELIYEIFKTANAGKPLFQLSPMTFKDPDTKQTFPLWVKYYKDLNKAIPEGDAGINPGSISTSDKLDIIYAYGLPGGWETNKVEQKKK